MNLIPSLALPALRLVAVTVRSSVLHSLQNLMLVIMGLVCLGTAHASSNSEEAPSAALKLEVEYSLLTATLELPLSSMVSFSSLPQSDTERQELNTQLAQFHQLSFAMVFPDSAGCQIDELNLNTKSKTNNHHAIFLAEYKITCPQPRFLNRVQISLFDHYERVTKLSTQVSASGLSRRGQLDFVNRYLLLR